MQILQGRPSIREVADHKVTYHVFRVPRCMGNVFGLKRGNEQKTDGVLAECLDAAIEGVGSNDQTNVNRPSISQISLSWIDRRRRNFSCSFVVRISISY
jgi:hypothetical protein